MASRKKPDGVLLEMPEPNPKQKEFFCATTRFIAYGGARGGGKSWAVRWKAALMALSFQGIRILVLRRTYPELRENHILPLLTQLSRLKNLVKYKETEKAFLFSNGSRLRFGYCDREADVLQYQGQEYDVIFMDEATQFTWFQFQTLTACLRGANSFPKRFYLTCNPGGVGHSWVKRLFIDREYKDSERPEDYTFIQARVYDNKPLMEKDPEYIRNLQNLSEDLRQAWLEGNWHVFVGQYFTEFREEIHVVKPFSIPSWWRRYFCMDYGLDMLAAYWIALDEKGFAYVYKELYQSGLIISDAAQKILEVNGSDSPETWYAPPDMWNRRQDTGRSVADIFAEYGICLAKAKNDRAQGWLDLKEWLKPIETPNGKTAALRIFPHCVNLIKSLPALQVSAKNPNDCAVDPHEFTHGPDAIRYFVAGRPLPAKIPRSADFDEDEPLPFQEQINDFLSYGA